MTLAEQTLQEYEKAEPALLLSAAKTAKLLGVGRTALYALNSSGRLPLPVRLGGRFCGGEQSLRPGYRLNHLVRTVKSGS